jgi:hypothetical protein
VLAAQGHCVVPVVHRRHHLDVLAQAEQELERFAEDQVVLDEGYADYSAFWTFPAFRHRVQT